MKCAYEAINCMSVYEIISYNTGSKFYVQFQYTVDAGVEPLRSDSLIARYLFPSSGAIRKWFVRQYNYVNGRRLTSSVYRSMLQFLENAVRTFLKSCVDSDCTGTWLVHVNPSHLHVRFVCDESVIKLDRNYISAKYLAYEFARYFDEHVKRSLVNILTTAEKNFCISTELDAVLRLSNCNNKVIAPPGYHNRHRIDQDTAVKEDIYNPNQELLIWGTPAYHQMPLVRVVSRGMDEPGVLEKASTEKEFVDALCSTEESDVKHSSFRCFDDYPYADSHYQNLIALYAPLIDSAGFEVMLKSLEKTHERKEHNVGLAGHGISTKHYANLKCLLTDKITAKEKATLQNCPISVKAAMTKKRSWRDAYGTARKKPDETYIKANTLFLSCSHVFRPLSSYNNNDYLFHDCTFCSKYKLRRPNTIIKATIGTKSRYVYCHDCSLRLNIID